MSRRPVVLVGFAEAFAAIEAVWSLQCAGMDVVAFARRGSATALRHMRGVSIVDVDPPERSFPGTVDDVTRIAAELRPDAFLPLDDSSLWLSHRCDLGRTVVAGPDAGGVGFALDKAAQVEAAGRSGLSVPKTEVFGDVSDVRVDRWPVILKAAHAVQVFDGRLLRPGGRICSGPAELELAQSTMQPGAVLSQTLVNGVGEGIFGLVDSRGVSDVTAHRRLRMLNPHGSASSACESIPVDEELRAGVAQLLGAIGWRGLFMAEFLRSPDGTAWFMELNGRSWGSLALARRRGYEYPAWAVQSALKLPRFPAAPEAEDAHLVARHLGREIGHLAFVLRGPQTDAVVDWPKRGRTVLDLLTVRRRDRLYNWNSKYPGVLVTDTWNTLVDLAMAPRRRRA